MKRLTSVVLTFHFEAQVFALLVSIHYGAKPGLSEECQEQTLCPVVAARNKPPLRKKLGTNGKDGTKVVAPRATGMGRLEQTNSPLS